MANREVRSHERNGYGLLSSLPFTPFCPRRGAARKSRDRVFSKTRMSSSNEDRRTDLGGFRAWDASDSSYLVEARRRHPDRGRLTRRVFAASMRRIWALPLPAGKELAAYQSERVAKKEGGTVECPGNAPKFLVRSDLQGVTAALYGRWYRFRRCACKTWLQSRRSLVYCPKPGSQNGNPDQQMQDQEIGPPESLPGKNPMWAELMYGSRPCRKIAVAPAVFRIRGRESSGLCGIRQGRAG